MDGIEVEGSAARAKDRSSDFFLKPPVDAGAEASGYLGDLDHAQAELRTYLGKVADVRKRYNADALESADAHAEIVSLADTEAKRWNAPGALQWPLDEQLAQAGTTPGALFMALALRLIQAMIDHESSGDDAAAQDAIDAQVDDAMQAIFERPRAVHSD